MYSNEKPVLNKTGFFLLSWRSNTLIPLQSQ